MWAVRSFTLQQMGRMAGLGRTAPAATRGFAKKAAKGDETFEVEVSTGSPMRILAKPRKARVARVGSDSLSLSLSLSLSVCLSVHQFLVLNLLPWSDHHAVRGAQAGRDA